MNPRGRVALVAGGARIGQTVLASLAERGCDLAIAYRSSRESAEQSARHAERAGVRARVFRVDTTRDADVARLVRNVKGAFGRLDILVNMVSVYESRRYADLRSRDWHRDIAANLTSAHLIVQQAAPLLTKEQGRVIHFSDWVAASGRPRYKDFVSYYAAKSGLIGLVQAQALQLAPRVLVNAIAPGPILPPAHIRNEEVRDVKKVTPLGRWGGAGEVAKAVLFLIDTDFVTGECIRVDGGRHLY